MHIKLVLLIAQWSVAITSPIFVTLVLVVDHTVTYVTFYIVLRTIILMLYVYMLWVSVFSSSTLLLKEEKWFTKIVNAKR